MLAVAGCLLMAGAAAVSANHLADDERIAICHATGSETNPYVFLMADKDGYEHGHHRHHAEDFFPADPATGCDGDEVPVHEEPEANGTEEPAGNETGNGTGNQTEEPSDDGTGGDDGDQTEEPSGNETGGDGNGTEVPENETPPAPEPQPGDAAVRQSAWQDDFEVVLTIDVTSVGGGVAQDVMLSDNLPDVRRTWYLSGEDASSCTLQDRALTCWFGDLAPGESAQVKLRAYTDRMPCGFNLTNTALVGSADDAEARNDASSASIQARAC